MAIFRCQFNIVQRSSGRSVVAAAAYRAGERLLDRKAGVMHDYRHKRDVVHREILAPQGAPDWIQDREELWNQVEALEKRKDAQLARECQVAFPRGLSLEQERDLVRGFVQREFVSRGMIADICIHHGRASDGQNQPHAHILLTLRQAAIDGLSKRKDRSWNKTELIEEWRSSWADHANQALKRIGSDDRLDHRSLYAQRQDALERGDMAAAAALDREPTVPRGIGQHVKQAWGWASSQLELYKNIEFRNELRRKVRDNKMSDSDISLLLNRNLSRENGYI